MTKSHSDDQGLQLVYLPLEELKGHLLRDNPREHDLGSLVLLFQRYKFSDPAKMDRAARNVNGTKGAIVYGNGRIMALLAMKRQGMSPPDGIELESEGGDWLVPVLVGLDLPNEIEAESFSIEHNNANLAGGSFGPFDTTKLWNENAYKRKITTLRVETGQPFATIPDDVLEALARSATAPELVPAPDVGLPVDESAEVDWTVQRWEVGNHGHLALFSGSGDPDLPKGAILSISNRPHDVLPARTRIQALTQAELYQAMDVFGGKPNSWKLEIYQGRRLAMIRHILITGHVSSLPGHPREVYLAATLPPDEFWAMWVKYIRRFTREGQLVITNDLWAIMATIETGRQLYGVTTRPSVIAEALDRINYFHPDLTVTPED